VDTILSRNKDPSNKDKVRFGDLECEVTWNELSSDTVRVTLWDPIWRLVTVLSYDWLQGS